MTCVFQFSHTKWKEPLANKDQSQVKTRGREKIWWETAHYNRCGQARMSRVRSRGPLQVWIIHKLLWITVLFFSCRRYIFQLFKVGKKQPVISLGAAICNRRSFPFNWSLTSILLQRYSWENSWTTWMSMNYETIPCFCIHDWLHWWILTELPVHQSRNPWTWETISGVRRDDWVALKTDMWHQRKESTQISALFPDRRKSKCEQWSAINLQSPI